MDSLYFFSRFTSISQFLVALLLSTGVHVAHAQTKILEGQVLNSRTGEPVPFATLGVPGRGLGTVADEQGHYLLRLPPSLNDTLIVSCVGFSSAVVLPTALATGKRIFQLAPQEHVLREIKVEHRRMHPALLGNTKAKGDIFWMGGSSGKRTVDTEWGWEFGALLKPVRRTYLEEFHVFLSANNYELLRFRLNLYAVEQGRPGRTLLSQDIQVVCSKQQQGWITVDLRPYEVLLDAQPVMATIQWLQSEKTDPEDKYFSIPVTRQSRQVMVERENSQAAWTVHDLQPSLYFTVMTE